MAPLDEGAPVGVDVRMDDSPDSLYRQIKDARNRARRQEGQAVWDDDQGGNPAEWNVVLRQAPNLLQEQSKDLEVAAWLIEALIREHGFAGLRDGFILCHGLIERYWDDLYPRQDPDEPEDQYDVPIRLAALAGLNGEDQDGPLVSAIKSVSLVSVDEHGPLGLSFYRQALALEKLEDPNERAARLEHGGISKAMFDEAVSATSAGFFRNLLADLEDTSRSFAELCQIYDEKCGPDRAPPSSNIKNALLECHECVTAISRDILAADMPFGEGGEGASAGGGGGGVSGGPIQTREQAFAVIGQLAQFFRRSEPHSILGWQLEECVRWGRMTLPELLEDIIADRSAREDVFKRVGIPPPAED